ncbi:phospholipase D, partial [Striga asiatica]
MAHYSYYSNPEGSYHGQAVKQHVPFRTSSDGSLRLHLLHGNLDIWVKEAKNLPNMDLLNHSMGNLFGSLSGKIQTSDPYVTVSVSNAVLARTFVIKDNENPVWAQHFHVPVAHRASEVQFVVKDNDLVGSEIIGATGVPAEQLVSGYRVNATYPLVGPNGRPCSSGAAFLSFSIQYEGVMNTGDDETRRYFKHSSVRVLLCPRIAGKGSWAKKQETGTIYTHHQKSVIVDVESSNYGRKIVAFVGGLDLCKGRYDTPQHPLFSTLQTIHKDDYHNPNFTGPTVGCPREPWHDLHCRIDGPAAYDVLKNFEERWLRAAKRHGPNKLKSSYDDCLLKLERMPEIMGITEAATVSEDDPESWNVQVFRSIDSNSVKGFPKNPREASERNLVCGKNVLIDMSVHTAYVKAIRSAQHFIYIENQYFLGSSYNWAHYKDLGANNLIPIEIALKIANKIRAGERFAAYILVPMWPEGVPTSTPTQRILFWQYNTMQMMYEIIYNALVETGLHTEYEPQDYLNFFCLGNREPDYSGSDLSNVKSSSTSTPQALSRKNRRFMIYVHSKGMIVDDEYIYGYRMSLWAEHTGTLEQCFEHPESLECVRRVRWMGEVNWREFESSEISAMRGHLLKYPVHVDSTGKVTPLPGCETFPDMGGKIIGTFTGIQENLTI